MVVKKNHNFVGLSFTPDRHGFHILYEMDKAMTPGDAIGLQIKRKHTFQVHVYLLHSIIQNNVYSIGRHSLLTHSNSIFHFPHHTSAIYILNHEWVSQFSESGWTQQFLHSCGYYKCKNSLKVRKYDVQQQQQQQNNTWKLGLMFFMISQLPTL